jgi:hypothetical protein
MTPSQIAQQISRVGRVTVAFSNIAALSSAAQALPVAWSFDPNVPADVVQYLGGAVAGAAKGAAIGGSVGLLLALFFPPAVIGAGLVSGALIGAVSGVRRVAQGWRVRVVFSTSGEKLLEVTAVR